MPNKEEKTGVSYAELKELLKTLSEQYNELKEITLEYLRDIYGIGEEAIIEMVPLTNELIDTVPVNELIDKMSRWRMNANPKGNMDGEDFSIKLEPPSFITSLMEPDEEDPEAKPMTAEEAWRDVFHDIKNRSLSCINAKKDVDDIYHQIQDFYKNRPKVSLKEIKDDRLSEMSELQERAKTEKDITELRKINNRIAVLESLINHSYLFERIDKYGDEELNRIMDAFFLSSKGGNYIMKKYSTNIKNFGYSTSAHLGFFNIEELFLPEKYHVYNNLFLFMYMRFTSYAIPSKHKAFVQDLLMSMNKLFQHRYASQEDEDTFKSVIMELEDRFEKYRSLFIEKNTSRPGHPIRVKKEKESEIESKALLISKLDQLKIKRPDNIDEMSSKDLHEYFNDEIDKLIESQREKKDPTGEITDVSTDADGVVNVEPNLDNKELSDTDQE